VGIQCIPDGKIIVKFTGIASPTSALNVLPSISKVTVFVNSSQYSSVRVSTSMEDPDQYVKPALYAQPTPPDPLKTGAEYISILNPESRGTKCGELH
jgi:hypothetical protein